MTINHINGIKNDNRLSNLELMTSSEQILHALHILGVGRIDQWGESNSMCKIPDDEIDNIKLMRNNGLKLNEIAEIYNVSFQQISKICRNERRFRNDLACNSASV